MWFVVIGVGLTLLKMFNVGMAANWSWWVVLSPFAAAAIWWTIADATGMTQRAAVLRHEKKVQRRRDAHLQALGMSTMTAPDSKSAGKSRSKRAGSDTRNKLDSRDDRRTR